MEWILLAKTSGHSIPASRRAYKVNLRVLSALCLLCLTACPARVAFSQLEETAEDIIMSLETDCGTLTVRRSPCPRDRPV